MTRWVEVMERHSDSPIRVKPSHRLRTMKRREAEHRNDATRPERTRAYRQSLDAAQLDAYLAEHHWMYSGNCSIDDCPYL